MWNKVVARTISLCILGASVVGLGCGNRINAERQPAPAEIAVERRTGAEKPQPSDGADTERGSAGAESQRASGQGEPDRSAGASRQETKDLTERATLEMKTPQGMIVRLPADHDPWADAVVSYKHGDPAPKKNKNPWAAVGKPAGHSVALGNGGTLVVEFIDNVLVDGPGDDLVIFEVGKAIEPTHVWISENGTDWIDVGRVHGGKSTVDIGPLVKAGQRFRFVKLRDAKAGRSSGSATAGADINGVGALHSLPVPGAPSRQQI